VSGFLRSSGFRVGRVSADRMAIAASGTALQVERAFSTSRSYHRVNGAKLRLSDRALSVPGDLAGIVVGVTGIRDTLARPFNTSGDPGLILFPGRQGTRPLAAHGTGLPQHDRSGLAGRDFPEPAGRPVGPKTT
jgi:hypothetical protein